MKNEIKKCPHCAEEILAEAKVCKHCGKEIKTKGSAVVLLVIIILTFVFVISALSDNSSTSDTKSIAPETISNTNAIIIAENFVEKHLKYPADSKFPGTFEKSGGVVKNEGNNVYSVTNYVDAANGFGAKQRTYYNIRLKYNGGDWADSSNWNELEFNFKE